MLTSSVSYIVESIYYTDGRITACVLRGNTIPVNQVDVKGNRDIYYDTFPTKERAKQFAAACREEIVENCPAVVLSVYTIK